MAALLTHRLRQGVLHAVVAGKAYQLPVVQTDDRIHDWLKAQERRPGKYMLWDRCFELPHKVSAPSGAAQTPAVILRIQQGVTPTAEIYDFPGEYAQRFDGVDKGGGTNTSPLPGHSGPTLYLGRRDRGVCIHGRAAFNRPGCIVVARGWTDLFRVLGAERRLSFVLEI